jgi:hypothetical protein
LLLVVVTQYFWMFKGMFMFSEGTSTVNWASEIIGMEMFLLTFKVYHPFEALLPVGITLCSWICKEKFTFSDSLGMVNWA